jgi:hypothetical protein
MSAYDAVVIGVAGLVLALPLGLVLLWQVRAIVFLFRAVRSPSWRDRPSSGRKFMDVLNACRDAAFLNKPPQLTRLSTLAVWVVAAIVSECLVCALYYRLPG